MKKGFKDYIVVRIKRTGHNLVTAATGLRNFLLLLYMEFFQNKKWNKNKTNLLNTTLDALGALF